MDDILAELVGRNVEQIDFSINPVRSIARIIYQHGECGMEDLHEIVLKKFDWNFVLEELCLGTGFDVKKDKKSIPLDYFSQLVNYPVPIIQKARKMYGCIKNKALADNFLKFCRDRADLETLVFLDMVNEKVPIFIHKMENAVSFAPALEFIKNKKIEYEKKLEAERETLNRIKVHQFVEKIRHTEINAVLEFVQKNTELRYGGLLVNYKNILNIVEDEINAKISFGLNHVFLGIYKEIFCQAGLDVKELNDFEAWGKAKKTIENVLFELKDRPLELVVKDPGNLKTGDRIRIGYEKYFLKLFKTKKELKGYVVKKEIAGKKDFLYIKTDCDTVKKINLAGLSAFNISKIITLDDLLFCIAKLDEHAVDDKKGLVSDLPNKIKYGKQSPAGYEEIIEYTSISLANWQVYLGLKLQNIDSRDWADFSECVFKKITEKASTLFFNPAFISYLGEVKNMWVFGKEVHYKELLEYIEKHSVVVSRMQNITELESKIKRMNNYIADREGASNKSV